MKEERKKFHEKQLCIFRVLYNIPGWPAAIQIQAEKGGGGEGAIARRGGGKRSPREKRGKGRDPGIDDRAQGSECPDIKLFCYIIMDMLIFSIILQVTRSSIQIEVKTLTIVWEVAQQAVEVTLEGQEISLKGEEEVKRQGRQVMSELIV